VLFNLPGLLVVPGRRFALAVDIEIVFEEEESDRKAGLRAGFEEIGRRWLVAWLLLWHCTCMCSSTFGELNSFLWMLHFVDANDVFDVDFSGSHTAYAILTGRVNPFAVVLQIKEYMQVQTLRTPNSHKLHKNAMFLCNHRSWVDFFLDQLVCNSAAYLSRLLVIPACPMSSLYAWIGHSTWFFNRKKGVDRDALGKYIQSLWIERPSKGLIVYPEGTRNTSNEPLKLKTGVLKMAYDYKRPVQCVITTNKEIVASEKTFQFQRGVKCITSISSVLESEKYDSFESFVEAVRLSFQETWKDAYSCDEKDAIPFNPPFGLEEPQFEPVPVKGRLWLVRFIIFLCLLLVWQRHFAA